jgi:hypothetical protein
MQQTDIEIKFSQAKASYLEVKRFLEKETGGKITSIDRDIEEDLQIAGDDTYELMDKFIQKYNLGAEGFDAYEHFHCEGELFNSGIIGQILSLPIVLVFFLIKLITFGRIDLTDWRPAPVSGREPKGMKFGDLVTWHLLGTFKLRSEVRFVLQK